MHLMRQKNNHITISIDTIGAFLVNYYYLLLIFCYFLCVFIDIRPAMMMFAVNVLLVLLKLSLVISRKKLKISLVTVYVLWMIISLASILFSYLPVSVYINSVLYVGTPIILFGWSESKRVDVNKVFSSFLYAIVFNSVFGIICFYSKPSFYKNYLLRTSVTAYQQAFHVYGAGRLVTMFGSIETGVLSLIAIIIALGLLLDEGSRVKNINALLISFVAMILSQQRGPIFAGALILVYLIIRSLKDRLVNPIVVVLIFVGTIFTFYYLQKNNKNVYDLLLQRLLNPMDAIEERTSKPITVLQNYTPIKLLFGGGIGSCEMFAEDYSNTGIYDGLYFNILGELGIVGVSLFLVIIVKALIRGLRSIRDCFIPLFIVFAIAFIGIGTTLIYYPQIMPIFWFSLGRLLLVDYRKISQKTSSITCD